MPTMPDNIDLLVAPTGHARHLPARDDQGDHFTSLAFGDLLALKTETSQSIQAVGSFP